MNMKKADNPKNAKMKHFIPTCRLFVFLVIIVFISGCGKDESGDPVNSFFFESSSNKLTEYEGIPFELKSQIFYDDFVDNSYKWPITSTKVITCEIANGNYNINCGGSSAYVLYNSNISLPENFELEIKMTFLNSSQGALQEAGLVCDEKAFFTLITDGTYRFNNSATTFVGPPANNSLIYPLMVPNIITLRKYGPTYYLFINKTLVKLYDFVILNGTKTGIYVAQNTSIKVEYINIYKILNIP